MSPELLKKADRYKNVLSLIEESELVLFMSTFIRRINVVTKLYWAYILLGTLTSIVLLSFQPIGFNDSRVWVIGIFGGILTALIPSPIVHELFHALAYKILGCKHLFFQWSWKKLRFYVRPIDFVISNRQYYMICSIPFFLLSILPLALAFFTDGMLMLFFLSMSFFHALYAMKDFSIMSYLSKYKNSFIFTPKGENKTMVYKSL